MFFKSTERKYLKELAELMVGIEDKKEMIEFLKSLLTPKELEEIPKRLQIVKLLKQGVSQRKIAKRLKVSIVTVTRGSNELKRGGFKILEGK